MDCQLFLKLAMNTNISELQCVATPHRANSTGTDGQFVLCGGARSTCPVSVKAEEAGRGQGGWSPLDAAAPPNLPGRRGMKDKQKARGELHSVPDVSKDLPELSQPLSGSVF